MAQVKRSQKNKFKVFRPKSSWQKARWVLLNSKSYKKMFWKSEGGREADRSGHKKRCSRFPVTAWMYIEEGVSVISSQTTGIFRLPVPVGILQGVKWLESAEQEQLRVVDARAPIRPDRRPWLRVWILFWFQQESTLGFEAGRGFWRATWFILHFKDMDLGAMREVITMGQVWKLNDHLVICSIDLTTDAGPRNRWQGEGEGDVRLETQGWIPDWT